MPHPTVPLAIQDFEMVFMKRYTHSCNSGFDEPCIVCGDFNAVYAPLDLHEGIPPETQNRRIQEGVLRKIISRGWVDAFRFLHPQTRQYSFFSQMRPSDRENNRGMRLDYQFVSPALLSRLQSCSITPSHLELSDHCAVVATYQT